MIGQRLGPYEITDVIGTGGMATVYRAQQKRVGGDVAVKFIHGNLTTMPDTVQRFQREARLIAHLEHLHILPVYDFDGSHDLPYIVMRFLEGKNRAIATLNAPIELWAGPTKSGTWESCYGSVSHPGHRPIWPVSGCLRADNTRKGTSSAD